MTAFTLHSIESAPEAAKPKLAAIEKTWKFIPNLHRMLAESPVTLEAYDTLFAMVARTSFTPAEQQVAFLAVNVFHGCEYCTSGHTILARKAGLADEAITALREGHAIDDARLEALRRFVEAVLRERGQVDQSQLDGFLAAGFTRAQVLEVVMIVATKTISNYANHLTGTPLDAFMAQTKWTAPRNRGHAA